MTEKTPEERGMREPLPVPEEQVAWEEDVQAMTEEEFHVLPVPEEVVVWEEEVQAMTEEEFYRYLEEQEGGLAFGA